MIPVGNHSINYKTPVYLPVTNPQAVVSTNASTEELISKDGGEYTSNSSLPVANLVQSLSLKPVMSELSCEEIFEKGQKEKIQGEFVKAIQTFEQTLTRCEKENNFALLLSSVENLGDIQLAQKKHRLAAQMYIYCLALLKGQGLTSKEEHYQEKLVEVIKSYLSGTQLMQQAAITNNHLKDNLRYRRYLDLARKNISIKLNEGETAARLTDYTTEMLQNIFLEMIVDCLQQLKKPDCLGRFAFIGIGSMARREMTPYSDIEFAVLIENDNPEAISFFKSVVKLLEIKVILLGETHFAPFGLRNHVRIPEGFRFDLGGSTPLSDVMPLLTTPATLASYQDPANSYLTESTMVIALRSCCLIHGSFSLYNEYVARVAKILDSPSTTFFPRSVRMLMKGGLPGSPWIHESINPCDNWEETEPTASSDRAPGQKKYVLSIKDKSRVTTIKHDVQTQYLLQALYEGSGTVIQPEEILSIGQNYGYLLGKEALKEFDPDLDSKILYKYESIVVKRELYRFPSIFLTILALYFKSEEKNFWACCEELEKKGKISKENRGFLTSIMNEIVILRFESQLYYEEQKEAFYLVDRQNLTEKRLVANSDQINRIKRIYQLLYPLHAALKLILNSRIDTLLLTKAVVYQTHSFLDEGKKCLSAGDAPAAIKAFRKELALDPDNQEALVLLRQIEGRVNILKIQKHKLLSRVEYYRTNHKEFDKALSVGDGLNQVMRFIQGLSLTLNLNDKQNKEGVFAIIHSPFCCLAAHLDTGIAHDEPFALNILLFLIEKLGDKLPKEMILKWCYECIGIIKSENSQDTSKCYLEFLNYNPDSYDYEKVAEIVNHLTQHVAKDHNYYPCPEIFIKLATYHLQRKEWDLAHSSLKRALDKTESCDIAQQTKLKIAIYDGLSRVAFFEQNPEEARGYMAQAVSFAKEDAHQAEVIKRRQASLENALLNNTQDKFVEESQGLLHIDDQQMADRLVAEGSSIAALPYLKRVLARDPQNNVLIEQIRVYETVKMMHEMAIMQIPRLIERFDRCKNLDALVIPTYPKFLLKPEYESIFKLVFQAPFRFHLAYFYGKFLSLMKINSLFQCNNNGRQNLLTRVLSGIAEEALQQLYIAVGDLLPGDVEQEIYLNLGNQYSEWGLYEKAEGILIKALELHSKYCSNNENIVSIYIGLGRIYKNTNRLEEAKKHFLLAIDEVRARAISDNEDIFYLYHGLASTAAMENNWQQATVAFKECVRICAVQNLEHHRLQMIEKFSGLFKELLSRALIKDILILIEHTMPYIPFEVENAVIGFLFTAGKWEEALVAPHLARILQVCAIKGSKELVNHDIYLCLTALLFNRECYSQVITVSRQAVELGVSEQTFDFFLSVSYYAQGIIDKALYHGERYIAENSSEKNKRGITLLLGVSCCLCANKFDPIEENIQAITYRCRAEDYLQKAVSIGAMYDNKDEIAEMAEFLRKRDLDKEASDYIVRFLAVFVKV